MVILFLFHFSFDYFFKYNFPHCFLSFSFIFPFNFLCQPFSRNKHRQKVAKASYLKSANVVFVSIKSPEDVDWLVHGVSGRKSEAKVDQSLHSIRAKQA